MKIEKKIEKILENYRKNCFLAKANGLENRKSIELVALTEVNATSQLLTLFEEEKRNTLQEILKESKELLEKHSCQFNDGLQVCDCYKEALKDYEAIIKKRLEE